MRGNYVLDRGGKVLQIDHWEYHNKISEKREPNKHPLTEYVEYLQPIPITEVWLIKLGFVKKLWFTKAIVIEIFYFQLDDIVVYLVQDFIEVELVTIENQFNFFKKWYYVHQLQNLYRALKKQPLNIKK